MPGEGLAAQHHEPADDAGHDGDDRARLERVDHEREREELPDVVDEVPRQPLEDRGVKHACVAAAVDERRLRLADDDEPSVGRAQHLDRRAVEAAERLARDHLAPASPRPRRRRRGRRRGRGS